MKFRFYIVIFSIFSFSFLSCMDRELVRIEPLTQSYLLDEIETPGQQGVDIIVMVDNSKSMTDEQQLLTKNFPELIRSLLQPVDAVNNETGQPPPDGRPDHLPVKDMHIGVVSSDMGTGNKPVDTCSDQVDGDDGILQHEPNPMIVGCDESYPLFLSYEREEDPPPRAPDEDALPEIEKLARDFGCIATLGNQGCGFEQQLEAVYKALLVHAKSPEEGGTGENAGFLRPDTILAILFVTDEEDCSVDATDPDNLRIFDVTLDAELGYMNIRCFKNPEMLYSIDRYVEGFASLREDPQNVVMGMIVGVPPPDVAPECNGFIKNLDRCLDHELMQEMVDPEDPRRMRQSCYSTDPDEGAFPPRRFIKLAQKFMNIDPDALGENVYIHSICTDDFTPAISAITNKIHEMIDKRATRRELQLVKDPSDPRGCTCMASCRIIETLPGLDECVAPKIEYDKDGDCRPDVYEDERGLHHTICEIPHSKMIISGCACCVEDTSDDESCKCALSCTDPSANLVQKECLRWECVPDCMQSCTQDCPEGYCTDRCQKRCANGCAGWWYDPYFDPDGEGGASAFPVIVLSGVNFTPNSKTSIQCRSTICPTLRRCGPAATPSSKCCDEDEYCYYPKENFDQEGVCLMRRDICEEYGAELWCAPPSEGPLAILSEDNLFKHQIGGICCVDHDGNGILEMEDTNGDGLLDTPVYRCRNDKCEKR